MSALDDVLEAAVAVADAGAGVPGAMARRQQLEQTIDLVRLSYPSLDVLIAGALWLDRYGRAGASDYARALKSAVDGQRGGGAG